MKTVIILTVLFCVSSCSFFTEEKGCITNYNKLEQNKLIRGVMKDKYKNENNRGLMRVEILNYDGNIYNFEHQTYFDGSFYNEVEVGDSVIKRKGFLDVIVVKKDGSKRIYLYNCSEIVHDSIDW